MEQEEYRKRLEVLVTLPDKTPVSPVDRNILDNERLLCTNNFFYWLKHYAKLSQAPTLDSPGGIIPFKLWDHTLAISEVLLSKKYISILKSRQIGASWLVAAYCTWRAVFFNGDRTQLFSKGELEAQELLSKCKRVYDHQPFFLRVSLESKSATNLTFKNGSGLQAMPSTENAGISFQNSRVVCDEHIEHEYASKNYMAVKPTIDSGGGQFISIFTANEDKLNSLAVELFLGGRENKNGFTSLFFPYTVRPGRSDDWYNQTKNSIPLSELQGITPDVYMARNYPRSIEEALSPSKTIAVFDKQVLDSMMGSTENPLEGPFEGIDKKIVRIYRPYLIGEYYVAATDTSHGIGQDYSVTAVLNVKTGAVSAVIYNNHISPEELALHSVRLLKLYNNPIWYIEDNDWGRVTINTALSLGYKNFGYRDDKKEKIGIQTNEKTRVEYCGAIIPAVNNRQVQIYDKECLTSLYDIIRSPEKNGRIEAIQGGHDDFFMCAAMAWTHKDKVQTAEWKPRPISSLNFGDNSANPALIMR